MVKSAFLATLTVAVAFGQFQDNRDKQLNCDNRGGGREARKCEMHEQTMANVGQLAIDEVKNGGVSVKGWNGNDVLVRSRVEAYGATDSDASLILSQVHVDGAAGKLTA